MAFETTKTMENTSWVMFITTEQNCVLCVQEHTLNGHISLPTLQLTRHDCWTTRIKSYANELYGCSADVVSIQFEFVKVWVPSSPETYVINIVMHIRTNNLMSLMKIPTSGKFSKLQWLSLDKIATFHKTHMLASIFLLDAFSSAGCIESRFLTAMERNTSNLWELTPSVLTKCSNPLIFAAINEAANDVKAIYYAYQNLIAPDVFMSFPRFNQFMASNGVARKDAVNYFRCADFQNRRFLAFNEFLGVVIVLEPSAKQTVALVRLRCAYVFRLVADINLEIGVKELKQLIILLRTADGLELKEKLIDNDLRILAETLNIGQTDSTPYHHLIKFAEHSCLANFAKIFRTKRSLLNVLKKSRSNAECPASLSNPSQAIPKEQGINIGDYQISANFVQFSNDGLISTSDVYDSKIFVGSDLNSRVKKGAQQSAPAQDMECLELLQELKNVAGENNVRTGNRANKSFSWGRTDPARFAQNLLHVLDKAMHVLNEEKRLLQLSSPLYVFGDLHGNYGDLLQFESMLWPLGLQYATASCLFLGDYVDRGMFGMEVAAHLLCLKVMHPAKMFLIRGNHEIRSVQINFNFYSECKQKFGDVLGTSVWEAINRAFDYLPFAAIVDGSLFCCHGGIPPPWLCPVITNINSIPKPIAVIDKNASLAWELMWNDPKKDVDISKEIEIELATNYGFATNFKRGTAHVFDVYATKQFLKAHQLSRIVRAHESAFYGFSAHHECKVISVFSSSMYCRSSNEAGCILVDDKKLKVIRFNTGNEIIKSVKSAKFQWKFEFLKDK